MKIIVLSPFIYYPGVPNGGGALCWGQLEGLAKHHEIHFLSFVEPSSTEYELAIPHLNMICSSVSTVTLKLDRLDILYAKLLLLLKLQPIESTLCMTDEMSSALRELICKVKPDVVFIQFPQMAQYISVCEDLPSIMDVQDAFSVSAYRRFKSQSTWLKKGIGFLAWLAWIRYETFWYSRFTVTTTLTEQDRIGLEVFSPGMAAITSHAAVHLAEQQWKRPSNNSIAFIGSFSHRPNVEALLFFINEIFPIILNSIPDAVFLVAGKGVPAEIQAKSNKNIRFVGIVPDSYEFVSSTSLVVVPLKSGGGIKIKTLEALACGCPVVATSIGMEETGAKSGTHLLVADSREDFAKAVISILRDAELSVYLGANARELIQKKFSWDAKCASLQSLLEIAAQRLPRKPTDNPGIV